MKIPNPVLLSLLVLEAAVVGFGADVSLLDQGVRRFKRVAFFGDSISQNGYQTFQVQLFEALRHPGSDVRIENIGKSGDMARYALARWDWDGSSYDPQCVFVMFGMNDVGQDLWKTVEPTDSTNATDRVKAMSVYERSLRQMVGKLRGEGREIVLLTPSPYDVYRPANSKELVRKGMEIALGQAADAVRRIGDELAVPVIDLHGPMSGFMSRHADLRLCGDRVHPGAAGSLLMSTLIWRALGETNEIGRIELDAAGKTYVSADYCPRALPFPDSEEYRLVAAHWPLLQALNREPLIVRNLPEGCYELKADGVLLGTFAAGELAAGVNLATLETPNLREARRANESATRLRDLTEKLRSVCIYEKEASSSGVNTHDEQALQRWLDHEIALASRRASGRWRVRCLTLLKEFHPVLGRKMEEAESYRAALHELRPVCYHLDVIADEGVMQRKKL